MGQIPKTLRLSTGGITALIAGLILYGAWPLRPRLLSPIGTLALTIAVPVWAYLHALHRRGREIPLVSGMRRRRIGRFSLASAIAFLALTVCFTGSVGDGRYTKGLFLNQERFQADLNSLNAINILASTIDDIAKNNVADVSRLYAPGSVFLMELLLLVTWLLCSGSMVRMIQEAFDRPMNSDRSLPAQSASKCCIFMSYRRHDSGDVAGRIYDRLVQEFTGQYVFRDIDNLVAGTRFPEKLNEAINMSKVGLVLIGPNWLTHGSGTESPRLFEPGDFVRREVEAMLENRIAVIPCLLSHSQMPDKTMLPASIQQLTEWQAVSIRSDPDFHRDVDRLISQIHAHI